MTTPATTSTATASTAPSSAAAPRALAGHTVHHSDLLIGGAEVSALSGATFERTSPAHDALVATYARGGADDVDTAVTAARRTRVDHGSTKKTYAKTYACGREVLTSCGCSESLRDRRKSP